MKKILLALSIGCISFAALSNSANAQSGYNPIAFNDSKNLMTSVRYLAALENPADLGTYVPDAKNINTKALKDFSDRFNSPENTQWFSDKNGFTSYFVKDGFGNRAYYDKKGHWQYSLIFYGEDKLPREIRAIVKSTYFDMNITLAEEVQTNLGMVYIIHVEDKANIKILRVSKDGDMDTMQDLTKQ